MKNEERYMESEPFYHAGPGRGRHRTGASTQTKDWLVKAIDLLDYAKHEGSKVSIQIVGDRYGHPASRLESVNIKPGNYHKCKLCGCYTCYFNLLHYKFDLFECTFVTECADQRKFQTLNKRIDFDNIDRDEFWELIKKFVPIPDENTSAFDLEPQSSDYTDEQLLGLMTSECEIFAIDNDADICAFANQSEFDEEGRDIKWLAKVSREDAFRILAHRRPGLEFYDITKYDD